jgi:hypothetical protein
MTLWQRRPYQSSPRLNRFRLQKSDDYLLFDLTSSFRTDAKRSPKFVQTLWFVSKGTHRESRPFTRIQAP